MSAISGTDAPFSLGREAAEDGSFARQPSRFRGWVTADGSSGLAAEPGRFHLYVSWACPWAHRAIIARRLKRLEDVVPMWVAAPIRGARGWAFTGGEYVDALNGFRFLGEAYRRTDPGYDGRFSVPVLWDARERRIVSNESGDILRMLGSAWDAWGDAGVDLYPREHRAEIDALNARIHDTVNDGVYKAGFSTNQRVYVREVRALFATLAALEERMAGRDFLVGDRPTEADWRLFTTLVRFDAVYYIHFKCSLRRLVDHPNLWALARRLYAVPGVAETVRLGEIRAHYYRTHPWINPSGLVPEGPDVEAALRAA
jgi:putative glutathione S-transferase